MPTLQILNKAPDFGEQLGQSLGSLLGTIGGGTLGNKLETHYQNQKINKTVPGISKLISEMTGQDIDEESVSAALRQGITPNELLQNAQKMAIINQKQKTQEQKILESENLESKSLESSQRVFDIASKMLKKNVPGIGISPLTKVGASRKGVQNRATFDTLRSKFEAALLPMVNKGTLAKERFNFLLSLVPKASESQRSIAGKLFALGKELGLDTSELLEIPWVKKAIQEFDSGEISESENIQKQRSLKDILG